VIAGLFRISRKSALWVGVLLVAVLLLYKACDSGGGDVRFRLAFAVSVDGAVKTGSSIIANELILPASLAMDVYHRWIMSELPTNMQGNYVPAFRARGTRVRPSREIITRRA
jgi:hypothetical protein